jgi:glycolate oxidase iron-sulfur subunit
MADIHALTRMMRSLEEQLVVCMRCGMCQAVCPVFEQTGREADVARGKLALLDGLLQEMFADPEGVHRRLNKCLLCGSCAANCPSGVGALEIFLKARAIITAYRGLPPAKRALLRGLLLHPELLDRLTGWGTRLQRLLTRPVNEHAGTSCARIASPLLGDRHFVPPADVPFHRRVPSLDTATGRSGLKAAFFVGCLIDRLFPRVAEAAVGVLDHHAVGLFLPADQACCGIPALSAGDLTTFGDLVRHNLERFERGNFDCLITACATCTATIREIWPMMADSLAPDLSARVKALAAATMDINAFLVSRVDLGNEPQREATAASVAATYHDPCHLKKSLGVSEEPRRLLQANRAYRLVEMAESDWCCGMGGSFNLAHYGISERIGRRKREAIAATGCSVVATGCPACMLQISEALSKAGDAIRVRHPVEIYWEGIEKP